MKITSYSQSECLRGPRCRKRRNPLSLNRNERKKRATIMKRSRGTRDKKRRRTRDNDDGNDISNPNIISRLLDNDDDDDDIIETTPFSSSSSVIDDDILVFEILNRLPAKSLMRFKCVCKRWWSLIQQDPYFHDLHLKRSIKTCPYLLISVPSKRIIGKQYLFSADLLFEGGTIAEVACHTKRKTNLWYYNKILKPVNGLICFIDSRESSSSVSICNLCTRGITPWIQSTLLRKENEDHHGVVKFDYPFPSYGFGFDPATKEHKVICMWKISRFLPVRKSRIRVSNGRKYRIRGELVCEILTVGQNSWRKIDEVPPYDIEGYSVYANGSIYWFKVDDDIEVIVAFDVGIEKFRVIPIPNFIIDQVHADNGKLRPRLMEFGGRLAIVKSYGFTVKLWIFDDDFDNKENITSTSSTSNRNWTEETISLPFPRYDNNLYFHVVAGTDQIILEFYSDISEQIHTHSLYSYNRKTKTFKKVRVSGSGISSFPYFWSWSLYTTFVESLLPVQKLQGHPTQLPPGK